MKRLLRSKLAKWFFHKYFEISKDKEIFDVQGGAISYWKNKEKGIAKVQFGGTRVSGIPFVRNSIRILFLLITLKFPTILFPLVFGTVDTYTSSDTWTCPAGVTSVDAECWAGGGGGGGNAVSSKVGGTGAGGGAYSEKTNVSVTSSSNYTVTVGAGGSGGSGGISGDDGNNGGDSWFKSDTDVLAKGGARGLAGGDGSGGSGGASVSGVGDTKYSGGDGGNDGGAWGSGGGGGGGAGDGANGGDASGATAGTGGVTDGGNGGTGGGGDGSNGSICGGGGGGGQGSGSSYDGGNGARGQVVLTYEAGAPGGPSIVGWKSLLGVGQAILLLFNNLTNYFQRAIMSITALFGQHTSDFRRLESVSGGRNPSGDRL